jgi:hypothetical protein
MLIYYLLSDYKVYSVQGLPNINCNGPAVEGVNVTRRKHRSRSRYFSQKAVTVQGGYGAIFAKLGERQGCPGGRICLEPKSQIWLMGEKFIVMIKLSRWRAKIVTSLLPQPSVLAAGLFYNCHGFRNCQRKSEFYKSR